MADNQADKDEQKKIRLEAVFERELRAFFNRLNKQNTKSIIATGNPVRAESFRPELQALLKKHYSRVQEKFSGDISRTLPADDEDLTELEEIELLAALMNWEEQKSEVSSNLVTMTNEKQISESVSRARQLLIEQGEEVNNRNLATTASVIFRRFYNPRISNIAITETQAAAEATKLMEADTLSGLDPSNTFRPSMVKPESKSTKTWLTVGGKDVRDLHARINGVRIGINRAFETGGERMLHPGDSSLGASAKNLAHCRCGLSFNINRVKR